jgi:hypothetical protein
VSPSRAHGLKRGAVSFTSNLTALSAFDHWLGSPNYSPDRPLFVPLIEFRIYDRAFTSTQIDPSIRAGLGALN